MKKMILYILFLSLFRIVITGEVAGTSQDQESDIATQGVDQGVINNVEKEKEGVNDPAVRDHPDEHHYDKEQHKIEATTSKATESDQETQGVQAQSPPKEDQTINDLDIESLFSFNGKDLWGKEYLQERITIKLVKKSWQAWGPANQTTNVLEDYHWDEALSRHLTACLEGTPPYQYIERPFKEAHLLLTDTDFNSDLPNIFIFPTFSVHEDIAFVQKTVTALAMRNLHLSYNIFVFDLSKLDFNMFFSVLHTYFGEKPNFHPMAKAIADFFVNAVKEGAHMKEENIHMIGWGYSAQLVGYVGRLVYLNTDNKLGSVVALNPIGAQNNQFMTPVNKYDAKLVYIFHSNSYPVGSTDRAGTADFVFNGGFVQPECKNKENELLCSHDGVVRRFWYMILYGGNLFEARKCDSLVRFNFGLCNKKTTTKLTYPLANELLKGKFFLRTSGIAPYGEGTAGTFSDPELKSIMEKSIHEHLETGSSKDDLMMFAMWLMN